MAKVALNKSLREEMRNVLVATSYIKQVNKFLEKYRAWSMQVYLRNLKQLGNYDSVADFEVALGGAHINHDWLRMDSGINIRTENEVLTMNRSSTSMCKDEVFTRVKSYEKMLHSSKNINLFFPSPQIIPVRNIPEYFDLSESEIAEHNKLIKAMEKKLTSVKDSILTANTLINSATTFEDLFEMWAGAEKLFEKIYSNRKAELNIPKGSLLPSVDFERLNTDLEIN